MKLKIEKIPSCADRPQYISQQLDHRPRHRIDQVNWPHAFDYAPQAEFSIVHDGTNVFLKFYVNEKRTAALETTDGQPVCPDSCVEFFISFGEEGYYNFEWNAIGTLLLRFRKTRPEAVSAPLEVLPHIERFPSLGHHPVTETSLGPWELMVRIPAPAFFNHRFTELSGVKARANFYKCGDRLSCPHYLSWSPVSTEKPDFHRPDFFGELEFE